MTSRTPCATPSTTFSGSDVDREQYAIMHDVEGRHWWYRGMRRTVQALLDRYLAPARTYHILDAGCGTGGSTQELDRFGVVTGIDSSPDALGYAAARGLPRLVQGSVEDLPFVDHSFDVVTSLDVLYHRAVSDYGRALRETRRVMRPGGIAVVRVPAFDWLRGTHDVGIHTERRFTLAEIAAPMTEAGFRVLHSTYGNALLFPLAVAKRTLERFLPASPADLSVPPRPINWVLEAVLSLEAPVASRVSLPIGLSAIVVGRA